MRRTWRKFDLCPEGFRAKYSLSPFDSKTAALQ
jgi:hypothetical protein